MSANKQFKQAPVRNPSVIGVGVFSHSGEFSTSVTDVVIPGVGISFKLIRTYRSGNRKKQSGTGMGWVFNFQKHIEFKGEKLFYIDDFGGIHQLTTIETGKKYGFPNGIYATLEVKGTEWIINQRYGKQLIFEAPQTGGRMLLQRDSNGNELRFNYGKDKVVITDTLKRTIKLSFDKNLLTELQDHSNRKWRYSYNRSGCLVEIIKPSLKNNSSGSSTRYAYDKDLYLTKLIDAKGKNYLRNIYDKSGRVVEQTHGTGTFKFEYKKVGKTNLGYPNYITKVLLKDATEVQLKHDESGHAFKRSTWINREVFSEESLLNATGERIEVITESLFNKNGELIKRIYPIGRSTVWQYDEKNVDPLSAGNLLKMAKTSSKSPGAKPETITTAITYETKYQLPISKTDGNGNLTNYNYDSKGNLIQKSYPLIRGKKKNASRLTEKFQYNISGQLIRHIDSRGAVTVYYYYSLPDPYGSTGLKGIHSSAKKAGGFLARIVKDPNTPSRSLKGRAASLMSTYAYDKFGNLSTIWDGKSNPTRIRYDVNNRIIAISPRSPFSKDILIKRDENGYPVEISYSFDNLSLDTKKGSINKRTSTIHEFFERNQLNNITEYSISSGNEKLSTRYKRDMNENILELENPMGVVNKYRYSGNSLIAAHLAAGKKDQEDYFYNYTQELRLGAIINKSGSKVEYAYDSFSRYKGYTNLFGIKTEQQYDPNNNIQNITISRREDPNERPPKAVLLQMNFSHDPCNRCTGVVQTWNNAKSKVATTLSSNLEYGTGFLPSKIISVSGKEFEIGYNGANQIILVQSQSGDMISIEYDANGNPVEVIRQNKKSKFAQMIGRQVDSLDRMKSRSLNGTLIESLDLNFIGLPKTYQGASAVESSFFHDGFGQLTAIASTGMIKGKQNKLIVTQFTRDKNGNLLSLTDQSGRVTQFVNDSFGRVVEVRNPDGTVSTIDRDSKGTKLRTVDANNTMIVERIILNEWLEKKLIEIINTPYSPHHGSDGLSDIIGTTSGGNNGDRLGTTSIPVELSGFDSTFDDGFPSVQDLVDRTFGFNPDRDLNLPGNEASNDPLGYGYKPGASSPFSFSDLIPAQTPGQFARLYAAGVIGALTGKTEVDAARAVVGMTLVIWWRIFSDIIDTVVGNEGKPQPPDGQPVPKVFIFILTPTEDTVFSTYKPKFTPPSLIGSIDKLIHIPNELIDPVWEEKDEPLGVLRQFNQATDPGPDQDEPETGGEIRTILGTNQAVTDPLPDNFIIVANVIGQLGRS